MAASRPEIVVPPLEPADAGRFYRGRSMLAVLRPGDFLFAQPATIDRVRPGDVVTFGSRREGREDDVVVHRVIAVRPDGLVTRGDTNRRPDRELVTPGNLLGRVVARERNGRRVPVLGGRPGLWLARFLPTGRRVWRRLRQRLLSLGRAPWRRLRESRLVPRLWRPRIRRVRFATRDGPVVKYIHGGRTVASWRPDTGRFRCSRPFDLVLSPPDA